MADKDKDGGKAEKAPRLRRPTRSPEAAARAEKAQAAKAQGAAKKEAESGRRSRASLKSA